MRRTLLISLGVLAALVALAVILPFVIPADTYRARIEDEATAATGRQLKIDGPLRVTIFPELGVKAEKVTLANVPGGHAPDFASMDSLQVGVKLIPLISGHIEVSQVTLNKPVIHLEKAKDGSGNWVLGAKKEAGTPGPSENAGGGMGAAASANFGGLRIADGQITYRDDATGKTRTLDNIDITIAITNLAEPVSLDGSLVTNGQKISLDAKIASPKALMDGAPTDTDLSLTSDLVQASFKGSLARNAASGTLKLDTPSLRKLAAWAGTPLAPGAGLGHLSLEGKLSSKGKTDSFSAIRLVLDKMTLTGALTLGRSNTVPFVGGKLAVNDLDLNPYLAPPAQTGGTGTGTGGGAPAKSQGWSTRPLDLSLLKTVNAKLTLSAGSLELRQLKIGKSTVTISLSGGALNADLNPVTLYGGSGRAQIAVNARRGVPHIANTVQFDNLAIKPFLTDALGVSRIEGTGTVTLDVSADGRSPNAIMHALAGKGAITFRNGRIRGVDLASVARTIQNALSGSATSSDASTDFTEMGGTFTVDKGVMTNKDFHLLSPFFRMTGAGTVDLGEQQIDFLVSPKAVSSIKGQGGEQNAGGIGIPFRIHGKWNDIHYTPDLSGAASSLLGAAAKGNLSTKGLLNGLLGGGQQSGQTQQGDQTQQGGEQKKQQPQKPLDTLKGLFGGH